MDAAEPSLRAVTSSVWVAALVLGAGHFLAPSDAMPSRSAVARVTIAAFVRAAVTFVIVLLPQAGGAAPGHALALAGAAGAVGFALESVVALGGTFFGDGPGARHGVALGATLLATGPLWLGPLVARDDVPEPVRNAVIAASPVCALAALAHEDILRSEAAYRRTPLARVRYAYPRSAAALAGWLGVGVIALAIRRVAARSTEEENR